MSTGKTSEPLIKQSARIPANSPIKEVDTFLDLITNASCSSIQPSRNIGITPCQEVRPWFPQQLFRTVGHDKGNDVGQC